MLDIYICTLLKIGVCCVWLGELGGYSFFKKMNIWDFKEQEALLSAGKFLQTTFGNCYFKRLHWQFFISKYGETGGGQTGNTFKHLNA